MRKCMTAVLILGALLVATPGLYAEEGGGFGIGAGIVKFSKMNPTFAIEPEAGWYRESEDLFGTTIKTDAFNFGGSALLIIPSEKVDLWGGAGLGAHMFHVSDGGGSTTKLGFHFLGGVDLKASDSMALFGAARYEIINTDSTEKLKQWKFYGGLRFTS
jgi:opacity protein-like surface antigen